jgi:hypothetical protein
VLTVLRVLAVVEVELLEVVVELVVDGNVVDAVLAVLEVELLVEVVVELVHPGG